ncbi:MAG: Phospho-N-acetylmuramoyl-pentapeptide-transferase [Candidatus Heimdallarchaeota archaeon AB_125]|nr:MAG: Phospho-N-acetylmuramoyl-pentapeptide-transferase [Candidatus Heimdallarchaeota archaeon AB_125]
MATVAPVIIYILSFLTPFIITLAGLPLHIRIMHKRGIHGVDVHKKEKPKVAERGGIIILLSIILSSVLMIILVNDSELRLSIGIFCITVTVAGLIGLVDDIVNLSAILKPFLLLFASIPIIASKRYIPEPILPFIGKTKLNIAYLILLPFVVAVPANSVNMLDVFNGSMATTTIIVLLAVVFSNLIVFGNGLDPLNDAGLAESGLTYIFILIMIGTVLAFWIFNRYPAKVFGGDTGSLAIGGALGAIAVMGRLEVVVIIAMIPFIMNAFGIISSVKGLLERREMTRPTKMTKDWKIESTRDKKAPITLVGLVIQKGPLHEKEVVKTFNILTIVSGILAIVIAVLINSSGVVS